METLKMSNWEYLFKANNNDTTVTFLWRSSGVFIVESKQVFPNKKSSRGLLFTMYNVHLVSIHPFPV